MNRQFTLNRISCAVLALGLLAGANCHAHGGGGYHGHNGGGFHGHREYYRGHGGYYRGDRGYWGGPWARPWFGPAVVIGVPFGGYYAYPEPSCTFTQRCYPNGECIETEICD